MALALYDLIDQFKLKGRSGSLGGSGSFDFAISIREDAVALELAPDGIGWRLEPIPAGSAPTTITLRASSKVPGIPRETTLMPFK